MCGIHICFKTAQTTAITSVEREMGRVLILNNTTGHLNKTC